MSSQIKNIPALSQNSPVPPPRVGPMGRGNPMGMMGVVAKPRNFKKTIRQLGGYLKPFWWPLMAVVIFTIASTIFVIVSPKLLGQMTNQIVDDFTNRMAYDQLIAKLPPNTNIPAGTTGVDLLERLPATMADSIPSNSLAAISALDLSKRPVFNYQPLINIAITLLILYGLSAIFSYLQGWIMTNITQKIAYRFRRDIAAKIGRLPLKYFDRTTHGEILSRITNDVDTVSQTMNQSLTQIIAALTMIIGILAMMISISPQMTLVAIITLPLSFSLIGWVVKYSQRYFKLQQDTLGHLNGHIEEMYSGHNVMKVFNGQAASIAVFNKHNKNLYSSAWRSQFLSGLLFPIVNFIGNVGYVGVTVLGGYLAIGGRINIGDIQAFIQYVSQFNQPIIQTANIANILQSTAASAERVFEFLAEAEESPNPTDAKSLTAVSGAIEFDHVNFGYDPGRIIINDFTAKIHAGQRVAIVGPTGAGKTTMVNLLMRFYAVSYTHLTLPTICSV